MVVRILALTSIWVMSWATCLKGQSYPPVLSLKDQAEVVDLWMGERLRMIMPGLMKREKIDLWVIISREYNEDPVIKTMLPATWLAARRRTILVLHHDELKDTIEAYAIARYDVGQYFKKSWDPDEEPDQWQALADLITSLKPKSIGINTSENFGLADGLAHTDYVHFMNVLPDQYRDKVTSAEKLAVGWLETRTKSEEIAYRQLVRFAHQIIAEGYASVHPGITTTDGLVWWFRQRIQSLGFDTWFHPTVSIQRMAEDSDGQSRSFASRPETTVIMPGDLVHCDIGIVYLRLNTDTQQHAYVLRPGEEEAPEDLNDALAIGHRAQDLLTREFKTGKSGNDILRNALEACHQAGIDATIYTHPLGFHGHAAGPIIGLWDQQGGVPGKGDYLLYPNTAHSIELNVEVDIPRWGKVRIMLEEDAFFDGEQVYYLNGRQKVFHLITPVDHINKQ